MIINISRGAIMPERGPRGLPRPEEVRAPVRLSRRLRRAGRGVAFGEVEDLDEGRGRLGAGDGVLAVDDEAGHAVDAEPPRIDVGGHDFLAALVAHQVAARAQLVDAGAAGAFDPDPEAADVEALLQIGLEQFGHDLVLDVVLGAPMDQAVRQHGVGRAPDARELEFDAGLAAAFGDRLVDLPRPVAAAELGAHIVVARHALDRHVGMELEGPPGHGHVGAAALGQGTLEAPLADVAPGTDRVGNDVDVNHAPSLRLSRQCRKRPAAAAIPSATEVSHAAAGQPPAATSAPVMGGPRSPPMLEPCISRPVEAPTSSGRGAWTGSAVNRAAGTTPMTAEETPASTSRSRSGTPSTKMPAAHSAIEAEAPTIRTTLGRPCRISQPAARLPPTFTMVTAAVMMAAVEVEKPRRSTCRVGRKPMTVYQQHA